MRAYNDNVEFELVNNTEDFTILETERDNFFKEIEAADLLRNKLLEHKKNIDSNQRYNTRAKFNIS